MSILLDWAMPKACRDCSFQIGGYCQMYSDESKRIDDVNLMVERPDWCPLIELPFAEELAEKLYKQIEKAVIEGSET